MRTIVEIALLAPVFLVAAHGQKPARSEFEVASIKANAPQAGFHFAADAASGGPGTADPAMFRCTRCSLATLIAKAFNLQPYQFPGRTSLMDNTFDIQAKVAVGATPEQFSAMLQNMMKDRFGLAWHYQEKMLKGYHLIVAKNGSKLKESTGATLSPAADRHGPAQGESHNHSGVLMFGSAAMYRAANQTTADLARILSDQVGLPVDNETGLPGKYDISLRWSGPGEAHTGNHSDGAFGGGYPGHEGGGATPSAAATDPSGPTLFDAIQEQLGLKLVRADQAQARLFVVDKVSQHPTEN